ncbi:complement C1q tumor necrosis factor-related protein 3-like isoform X2 [Saccostrea echinata]|nr:complement C1q tumor necrosis factor-related protein 3-like isoform X2 [Saccostrea echinata]
MLCDINKKLYQYLRPYVYLDCATKIGLQYISTTSEAMNSKTTLFLVSLLCMIIFTRADSPKPKTFRHDYVTYKNVCREMDWVPKCDCHKEIKGGCQGKFVAFHAILSKRLNNIPVNTILKFGNVLTNEGGGYNPSTGKFTAPEDGVYSFSWTYCTNKGSNVYVVGVVDGTIRAYISNHGQANNWQNTSGHLVMKLKTGNQFWIKTYASTSKTIHENYTFLSGYKLSGC